jgi:hypothetical protein
MNDKMQTVMFDFKNWCGMPNVMGVINGTHISITKPFGAYSKDYFFHKIRRYNVVAKVVVNNKRGSWMFMWDCLGVWMTILF